MKPRTLFLITLPILAFAGWWIWEEGFGGGSYLAWEEDLVRDYQVLSPEAVSWYRAGDPDDYPGYIYQLTPRDQDQLVRERTFWEESRRDWEGFVKNDVDSAAVARWAWTGGWLRSQLAIPDGYRAIQTFHPTYGLQLDWIYLLGYAHQIENDQDCDGYVYRLQEMPQRLEEALRRFEVAVAAGWQPGRATLAATIDQLRALAAVPVQEQTLYRSLATRMTRLDPTLLNEYEMIDFLTATATALEEDVMPAWRSTADRLEQLLPQLPEGVSGSYPEAWVLDWWQAETATEAEALRITWQQLGDSLWTRPALVSLPDTGRWAQLPEAGHWMAEIARASAGIYPQGLLESIRLRPIPDEISQRPATLPASLDRVRFPIVFLPDSAPYWQLQLDLYQYGYPGIAYQQQLAVEDTLAPATRVWRTPARWQGAGWAALRAMQERLLWFSRDERLLQAWRHRLQVAQVAAWLDGHRIWGDLSREDLLNQITAAGWTRAAGEALMDEVAQHPGESFLAWYFGFDVGIRE